MGPVHLPKQPPSVDGAYLYNNDVTECNVPCNEVSHIKCNRHGQSTNTRNVSITKKLRT